LEKDPLKVAVVGLGKMGLLHSGILNVLPRVKLVGVCEATPLTRRIIKKVLRKIPVVEDVSELSRLDLDALFITTPTSTHYSVARTAIERRIADNIFIEKPLSNSYAESRNLDDLMIGKGVNMVGYVRRFMVTFMKGKELLSQGVIGNPVSFEIKMSSSDFFGINDPTVSIARGGVLKDLGCYPIDLILWYFGEFRIEKATSEALTGPGATDAVHFNVHGSGIIPSGEVFVTWCAEGYRMPEIEFFIIGSKGILTVNDDYVKLESNGKISTFYRLNLNDNTAFWLGSPEYYREDEFFVQAIEKKLVGEPSFASAAKVELVIEEVQKKADNK
jgi:predicted dehydrogenase